MAAWGQGLTDRVAKGTATRYLCSLGQLEPFLAGKAMADINGELIADIIKVRRSSGASVATIKRDLVALSSVMGFAIDEGWLESNPVLPRLGRLKERRDPIALPDPTHIEIVIRRTPGRLRDLIRAAVSTGCRQEELASALTSQFSEERRKLTVVGKGNKRRTIDLSDAAVGVIRPTPLDIHYLFTSREGDRYKSVSTRFFDLVRGHYGIPTGADNDGVVPFRFHDLRHRYAVDYLKAGGSIYDLQQHLGHSSVKTTEIYLDYLSPAETRAAKFEARTGTKMGTAA